VRGAALRTALSLSQEGARVTPSARHQSAQGSSDNPYINELRHSVSSVVGQRDLTD
jgi:hypothetical protein